MLTLNRDIGTYEMSNGNVRLGFISTNISPVRRYRLQHRFHHLNATATTTERLATTGDDVNVGDAAPPSAGQVLRATDATHATWQTLTGGGSGTYQDDVFAVIDNVDNTKRVMFEVAQVTSGVTVVLTIPNATTTLVGIDTVQTLTNKTLDADQNTVTNIDNADIKAGAGIDAAKIHDGSVSNTEYGHLNGVTSAIQTQLDNKADVGHTHDTITTTTTTTNAATTIDTIATASDTTYFLTARIVARRSDAGSESAGFELKATYRNNSGTLTQVGADDVLAQTDTLVWQVDTADATTNILLRVHGETGKTIEWRASRRVLTV